MDIFSLMKQNTLGCQMGTPFGMREKFNILANLKTNSK
jgi:hypothetical protein